MKKSKLIAFALSMCMIGSAAPEAVEYIGGCAFTANAADYTEVTEGSLTFRVYTGYASLYTCDGTETDVVVPDTIEGVPVISVAASAFYDSSAKRCAAVETITLPDSVVNIGGRAFSNLKALKSFEMSDNVTDIGEYVFSGCSSLTSVRLSEKLTIVPAYTFKDCTSLEDVNIPKQTETIDVCAFANTGLTSVTIPGSVKEIKSANGAGYSGLTGAFQSCEKLETVIMEEGVGEIGYNTFDGCTALVTINIPSTASILGGVYNNGPFDDCISLKNVTIAEGALLWRDSLAFHGCISLEEIILPKSFNRVVDYEFQGCTSLKSIDLPDNYTSIGSYAFQGCTSLEEVTLPKEATIIYSNAFNGCTSLTEIEIPKNIETVEARAFANCAKLDRITFYNAKCNIRNSGSTEAAGDLICNYVLNDVPYFNGTIVGYAGSTAQAYAEKYGYKFEELPLAMGDVNGDTAVDSSDAALTLQHYAVYQSDGVGKFTEQQLAVADYNSDGLVDSSDAALILKTYAENQSK